jgi:hypothetical protein
LLDFKRQQRLEEMEHKVEMLVPKKNRSKPQTQKPMFKQNRDADEQFRRKHSHMMVNLGDPAMEKFTNKQRYYTRVAENQASVPEEEDEIWEPHRNISKPRHMNYSFFNNMNLVVWGGVLHHPTGY